VQLANSGARAWVPDDLNSGRLELFFFTLAGVMAATLVVFALWARRYEHNKAR
jgi:hypothetical protein